MVMFAQNPERTELYKKFERPTPLWYKGAGFGIFIHWGPYSVPAWAEPIGPLGTVADKRYWMAHNPYAEWYMNTIRIEGSPAREHHESVYGGAPYDEFIDQWKADNFDPDDMLDLFSRAGARYVIPVTKHHDGVTLWDAPGTGERNTVHRGPKQDLVRAIADATRDAGLHFGVYYSSGLDWYAAPKPPLVDEDPETHTLFDLPDDETYARYVNAHVSDLIEKYQPDVLWGDIDYPEAGETDSDFSFVHVIERFYEASPDGVMNDRWGRTHWDFRTSEYVQGAHTEGDGKWERNRGIGYSFGYNQLEGADTYLNGVEAIRMLVDVVSRGGNFLLNVGPDASGRIPDLQRACLEEIATWMSENTSAVHDVESAPDVAPATDQPWTRWTRNENQVYLAVEASGWLQVACDTRRFDVSSAVTLDGTPVQVRRSDDGVEIHLPPDSAEGPRVIAFQRSLTLDRTGGDVDPISW